MCESKEVTPQAKTDGLILPWLVLTWGNDGVMVEENTSANLKTMRDVAERLANEYPVVYLMSASMIAKWGPKDPGGIFNSATRKKRDNEASMPASELRDPVPCPP